MATASRPNLDPEELIVRAEYFLPIEPSETNLRKLKDEFRKILRMEDYIQTDGDLDFFGPTHRSMTFKPNFSRTDPPLTWKLKDILGLTPNNEVPSYQVDHLFEKIEKRVEGLPFEIEFRFRTGEFDGAEGYQTKIIVIPTLLQQYRQGILTEDSEYDIKTTVKSTKIEIERILSKVEAKTLQNPYTEAELIESDISVEQRDAVGGLKYGNNALKYLDEGDACFQKNLLNAALNCYVICIEWIIITHLHQEGRRDIIQEEKEGGGEYYWELVEELEDDKYVSQRTYESLKNMNSVERRWIAHHKSGKLSKTDVRRVRERLGELLRELFPK